MEKLLILNIEPNLFFGGFHEIVQILPTPGFTYSCKKLNRYHSPKGAQTSISIERSSTDLKQYRSLPLDEFNSIASGFCVLYSQNKA
jgi:hypothetical protein